MSGNLEDLSNDEIRVRLLEYGFANLPVTQTTRKVLIKKLKNAMETQKTKNRRETVAVIKSSDEEDVPDTKSKREKTPNRRATIAVTEKTRKVPASSSTNGAEVHEEISVKPPSRRTSRATPAKDQKTTVSSSANVKAVQEDSDEDVIEVPIVTRRSKTPTTMAKSEIVRTSYKTTTEPVVVIEKMKENYTNIQRKEEVLPLPPQPVNRRKTFTTTTTTDFIEPTTKRETPTRFGKTSLTTSYNPSGTYRLKDDYENDEELELNESNTPYLSNFAKRLSTLKAEPLDVGLNKYKDLRADDYANKPSTSSYRYTTYSSNKIQPTKRGVVDQMARDFNSLDRKYSIRKYVYVAMIVILIVAIYVFLFL